MKYPSPKTFLTTIFFVIFILLISFILGLRSSQELKRVVIQQFNHQQLLLARQVAQEIKGSFNALIEELIALKEIYSTVGTFSPRLLQPIFQRIQKFGAKDIFIIDDKGKVIYQEGVPFLHVSFPIKYYFNNKEISVLLERPWIYISTSLGKSFIVFLIDSSLLVKKHVEKLCSGKTGYAWVIDDAGYFVYHPIKAFIGQNAFKARQKKAPYFYFKEINEIQRQEMLQGKEGTGEYISLWHRGLRGYIKKIVAYTPVHIPYTQHIWSVAVCAPEKEVSKVVHYLYLKQFIIQGSLIFTLIWLGLLLLSMEKRFRTTLEEEVVRKTIFLRKSEERYRLLIESADDLILTLDLSGKILSLNQATANFFNKKPEEIIGQRFDVIMQWPIDTLAVCLNKLSVMKRSIVKEHLIKIGDKKHWLNTKLMPLRLEGKVKEILCIAREVTQEKLLQEQLSNTEKLASLGTLAAGVAHEINNPLGIIIGFGELLLENTPKESQAYQDIKLILKHALHCKNIVENLLNFARSTKGLHEMVDINEAIREIISIIKHPLEINNIKLETMFASNLPLVRGDKRELQQVFLNLIINAIDAMPKGGKLSITTELDEDQSVKIVFQDTGHGIKREHLDKIFDPFFTTKPEGKGTGLGLSVSYSIISKYNGRIRCESEEGKGATFIINLLPAGGYYDRENLGRR